MRGVCRAKFFGSFDRQIIWQITHWVVGACLIGDDVGDETLRKKFWKHVGRIADNADREFLARFFGCFTTPDCVFERVSNFVKITSFDSTLHASWIDINA